MKFEAKEVTLNDGRKVILKSHDKGEGQNILDMLVQCAEDTYFLANYPEELENRTVESEEEWIQNGIENPNEIHIGAYVDGKCVGNCGICTVMGFKIKTRHRASFGIGITKQYCNSGLGSIMIKEALTWAKNAGYEQVELGVFSDNKRAFHLYESNGFIQTSIIPKAFKLKDGSYRDEIMMTCFFDSEER